MIERDFQAGREMGAKKSHCQNTGSKKESGMARKLIRALFVCLLVLELGASTAARAEQPGGAVGETIGGVTAPSGCRNRSKGRVFGRTELFFGLARPHGGPITDGEFRRFLDDIITPRFPEGLTVLSASGQFRGSSGRITREEAVFVILLYPLADPESDRRIEEIRSAYRDNFQQESVLRIDEQSCVTF
jgi:Protein of unknown function (DUF3574)